MKVKIFQDKDITSLEQTINAWLDSNPSITIIDMRFTSTAYMTWQPKINSYSDKVIILYK